MYAIIFIYFFLSSVVGRLVATQLANKIYNLFLSIFIPISRVCVYLARDLPCPISPMLCCSCFTSSHAHTIIVAALPAAVVAVVVVVLAVAIVIISSVAVVVTCILHIASPTQNMVYVMCAYMATNNEPKKQKPYLLKNICTKM